MLQVGQERQSLSHFMFGCTASERALVSVCDENSPHSSILVVEVRGDGGPDSCLCFSVFDCVFLSAKRDTPTLERESHPRAGRMVDYGVGGRGRRMFLALFFFSATGRVLLLCAVAGGGANTGRGVAALTVVGTGRPKVRITNFVPAVSVSRAPANTLSLPCHSWIDYHLQNSPDSGQCWSCLGRLRPRYVRRWVLPLGTIVLWVMPCYDALYSEPLYIVRLVVYSRETEARRVNGDIRRQCRELLEWWKMNPQALKYRSARNGNTGSFRLHVSSNAGPNQV